MKLSKKAVGGATAAVLLSISALIKPWEGLELRSYPDIVGVWTACYGETMGIKPGMKFTKQECEDKLLVRVVNDYYRPLTQCIPDFDRKPVEWQAAAVSVTYNIGVGAACKSTAARLAREGKIRESCHAWTKFNRAGGRVVKGLVNRRNAELAICLKGA
ncbi:glycoside hydrolase family protein [Sinorhizobium medicae]|nr:glycoside hydrolase family protein [Sinorhizobium medicae]